MAKLKHFKQYSNFYKTHTHTPIFFILTVEQSSFVIEQGNFIVFALATRNKTFCPVDFFSTTFNLHDCLLIRWSRSINRGHWLMHFYMPTVFPKETIVLPPLTVCSHSHKLNSVSVLPLLNHCSNSWQKNSSDLTSAKKVSFTLSGSFVSLSHPESSELPDTPDRTTGIMEGGVCAQPPPIEVCRREGGVFVQLTNGRELWRINWAGLRPGGGGSVGGGRICGVGAEETGTWCWDWFWLACERICI